MKNLIDITDFNNQEDNSLFESLILKQDPIKGKLDDTTKDRIISKVNTLLNLYTGKEYKFGISASCEKRAGNQDYKKNGFTHMETLYISSRLEDIKKLEIFFIDKYSADALCQNQQRGGGEMAKGGQFFLYFVVKN